MCFNYLHYKRYFEIAFLWIIVSAILKYDELNRLYQGSSKWHILVILIIQFIVIPICFILQGLYIKNISIRTDLLGLTFKSFFKQIHLSWNEIIIIERHGSSVRVKTLSGNFAYHPMIGMDSKEIRNADNVFKRCKLLQEIHLKAVTAEFRNFPEDTF